MSYEDADIIMNQEPIFKDDEMIQENLLSSDHILDERMATDDCTSILDDIISLNNGWHDPCVDEEKNSHDEKSDNDNNDNDNDWQVGNVDAMDFQETGQNVCVVLEKTCDNADTFGNSLNVEKLPGHEHFGNAIETFENIPVVELPNDSIPVEELPNESIPVEELPNESIPVEELPNESIPVEELPNESITVEELPNDDVPVEFNIQVESIKSLESQNIPVELPNENIQVESQNIPVEMIGETLQVENLPIDTHIQYEGKSQNIHLESTHQNVQVERIESLESQNITVELPNEDIQVELIESLESQNIPIEFRNEDIPIQPIQVEGMEVIGKESIKVSNSQSDAVRKEDINCQNDSIQTIQEAQNMEMIHDSHMITYQDEVSNTIDLNQITLFLDVTENFKKFIDSLDYSFEQIANGMAPSSSEQFQKIESLIKEMKNDLISENLVPMEQETLASANDIDGVIQYLKSWNEVTKEKLALMETSRNRVIERYSTALARVGTIKDSYQSDIEKQQCMNVWLHDQLMSLKIHVKETISAGVKDMSFLTRAVMTMLTQLGYDHILVQEANSQFQMQQYESIIKSYKSSHETTRRQLTLFQTELRQFVTAIIHELTSNIGPYVTAIVDECVKRQEQANDAVARYNEAQSLMNILGNQMTRLDEMYVKEKREGEEKSRIIAELKNSGSNAENDRLRIEIEYLKHLKQSTPDSLVASMKIEIEKLKIQNQELTIQSDQIEHLNQLNQQLKEQVQLLQENRQDDQIKAKLAQTIADRKAERQILVNELNLLKTHNDKLTFQLSTQSKQLETSAMSHQAYVSDMKRQFSNEKEMMVSGYNEKIRLLTVALEESKSRACVAEEGRKKLEEENSELLRKVFAGKEDGEIVEVCDIAVEQVEANPVAVLIAQDIINNLVLSVQSSMKTKEVNNHHSATVSALENQLALLRQENRALKGAVEEWKCDAKDAREALLRKEEEQKRGREEKIEAERQERERREREENVRREHEGKIEAERREKERREHEKREQERQLERLEKLTTPQPLTPIENKRSRTNSIGEKTKRRRTLEKSVIVILSGFVAKHPVYNLERRDAVLSCLSKLNVHVKSDGEFDDQVTHLIASPDSRTLKFYAAALTGKWIVSYEWAEKSAECNYLLPEQDYGERYTHRPFKNKKIYRTESFLVAVAGKAVRQQYCDTLVVKLGKGIFVDGIADCDMIFTGDSEIMGSEITLNKPCYDWGGLLKLIHSKV